MKISGKLLYSFLASLFILGIVGCATESHQAIIPDTVTPAGTPYTGDKSTLMVGKFNNHSPYMNGLFSDGVDRLGGQAKSLLITDLQQTGRFNVVDRDNMQEITNEAAIKGENLKLKGATTSSPVRSRNSAARRSAMWNSSASLAAVKNKSPIPK